MLRSKRVVQEDQLVLGAEEQCSVCLNVERQTQRFQNVTALTLHPIQNLETAEKGIT